MKKYSVTEFAEIVGVTKQSVYKSLPGKLKGYKTKTNGKIQLKETAIQEYDFTPGQYQQMLQRKEKIENRKKAEKKVDKDIKKIQAEMNNEDPLVYFLKVDEKVDKKVDEKVDKGVEKNPKVDKKVENIVEILLKQINEKDAQIKELHTLLNQQQQLNLVTSQRLKELETKQTTDPDQDTPPGDQDTPPGDQEHPQKKPWYKRIWG